MLKRQRLTLILTSVIAVLLVVACAQPANVPQAPAEQETSGAEVPSAGEAKEAPASGLDETRLVPEITFVIPGPSYDPIRYESGLLLANEWEKLGLNVNVEAFGDFTALANMLQETPHDDFNAFISGYVSRPERLDPDVLLYRPFHCSGVETGVNYQGYCTAMKNSKRVNIAQARSVGRCER